ncbi:THUMP domain-containing class I SAM-dependent methyltransferase [Dictyobacter arantiisoli]|uniref:RNA methyltransferase n=1 Tax=Dictyobacter arantiisoli TaxID=2014874 RepID=A0A5A5T943_9CHLR|nr:methyltransferase domain-containing protein [Dictyobacter arantiisoli]GCF07847.1 RNA methyltransferase [Dictyobacter arantiisoli]
MANLFYAMTMPGLETLAFSEIRAKLSGAELVKFMRGVALFRSPMIYEDILDLRTTEDVFASLVHIKGLRRGPEGLRVLHSATLNADLEAALMSWRRTHHGARPRTWRVVSQMTGSYDFRRMDGGKAISDALRRSLPRGMRLVEDDADLEVWLWLGSGDVLIGVRLSDASMRHRTYKREHLPASLRPTVAAAMGWLSRPDEHDIVLDPLCGAGTILIERALLGPVEDAIGGDIRDEAVSLARRNARAADVDATWKVWDARTLPLSASSVTRIITNLPFGKQIGTKEENEQLYTTLIQEFDRVLAPKGLMVSLTSEDRLWDTILREHDWRIIKKVVFVVLGQPASIFVTERS